jgi:hypothetical protein
MITSARFRCLGVQQVADLLDQAGLADLDGCGPGVAEHLASLVAFARGYQQLGQRRAHDGDPVRPLQTAENLERLNQPGKSRLIVLPRKVDLSQVPAGGSDPVQITKLPMGLQPLALQISSLVVITALVRDVRDLAPGDRGRLGVTEPFVDRQLNLAADPQRLVVVPPADPPASRRAAMDRPPVPLGYDAHVGVGVANRAALRARVAGRL